MLNLEFNQMYQVGKYSAQDKMSDLICDNYSMLFVMSRFNIALGFGEHSIGEVCRANHVDVDTFLAVVNLLIGESFDIVGNSNSILSLMTYLKNSHRYFLDYRLISIRRKLIDAIDTTSNDLSLLIIHYYDEYVAEVRKHMQYEENVVFPYVEELLGGNCKGKYNIGMYLKQHEQVELKLTELKNLIIKYYQSSNSNELNSALFDIFICAKDLASHNEVEDYLFVPAVETLEGQ